MSFHPRMPYGEGWHKSDRQLPEEGPPFAYTDENRRRFEEDLRAELARSGRYSVPGALLMLDLDNFKQVNDTLGHPAGYRVIAEIAEAMRGRAR